jgi:branched-subunit amino acid aminotransferase/4-amino-4-deoxychorismate lyase
VTKPGLFTTLRVSGGDAWFWPAHLERLRTGAAELGLVAPDEDGLQAAIAAAAGGLPDARVRVTLHPDREPSVEAAAYAPPSAPWRLRPVAAAPSREQVRLKTTARTIYDAARKAAGDLDDALLVGPDGGYLEATVANLFLVDAQGRLRTPPAAAPLLPGIARARVLAAARALGLDAGEGPLHRVDAARARECFVTNALFVAHPVGEIEGVNDYARGGWAERLREVVIQGATGNRIIF